MPSEVAPDYAGFLVGDGDVTGSLPQGLCFPVSPVHVIAAQFNR